MNKRAALCPFTYRQVKLTKSPGKPLKNFEKIFEKIQSPEQGPLQLPTKNF